MSAPSTEKVTWRHVWDAIYDLTMTSPMWVDDHGQPLDYSPERERRIGAYLEDIAAQLEAFEHVAKADAWDGGYDKATREFLHSDYCGFRCQCDGPFPDDENPYRNRPTDPDA